jgi:glucose-6-phosphate 1-epimerase
MDISQLNSQFARPDQLIIVSGQSGFPLIQIRNASAEAVISLYGGQVLSFRPLDQTEDLIYLSRQSEYLEGKAIRGGIPVCWPWFGPDPKGLQRPNHGFVRNHFWQLLGTEAISADETKVSLLFKESFKQESTWRQQFALTLNITVGRSLHLQLTTANTSDKPFSITQAFHTYFRVGDIDSVSVIGLDGCEYFDKLEQGRQKTQEGNVRINREVDSVFVGVDNDLIVDDPILQRRILINAPNTRTAVVWNPWVETSRKMSDLADDAYKQFVCVEAGNIAFDLIQLRPGEQATLEANYSVISA